MGTVCYPLRGPNFRCTTVCLTMEHPTMEPLLKLQWTFHEDTTALSSDSRRYVLYGHSCVNTGEGENETHGTRHHLSPVVAQNRVVVSKQQILRKTHPTEDAPRNFVRAGTKRS